MLNRRTLAASLLSLAFAGFASAETAKETFDKLFGAEVKRVSATPEPADDVELAGQLLGAARNTNDNPAMRDLLCDWAYALGAKDPSGYPTAVDAMKLLAESNAEQKATAETKITLLYQRGYERSTGEKKQAAGEQYVAYLLAETEAKLAVKDYAEAVNHLRRAKPVAVAIKSPDKDAIQAKLDYYGPLALAAQKIESAQKKLKTNPWDKAAHGVLVEAYLTDMDNPAQAYKHIEIGGDETQKKMVPLANKPTDQLSEADALALAGYYEELGKKGIPPTKIAMLTRSRGYYEMYLTLHTGEGVQRAAVVLSQKRVADTLAKLEAEAGLSGKKTDATASADGKAIELLDYVDPSRDARRGKWLRSGDTIIAEQGSAFEVPTLRVPVKIEGGYNLKIKFVRDSGDGSFGVILPVGSGQVSFAMGLPPDGIAGLSDINRQPAMNNDTRKEVTIANGKVQTLDITVKAEADGTAAITVTLEGKSIVEWKGNQSDLSLGNLITLNDKAAIGFSAWNSSIIVGSAKIKPLTGGKTEMTEKAVEASVKTASKSVKPTKRDDERRDREKMIEDFLKGRFKQ